MFGEEVSTGLIPEVIVSDSDAQRVRVAVAGFLAGYSGSTCDAYALDLRQWVTWCTGHGLDVFAVRRAHIELFARYLEENGKARATVVSVCRPLVVCTGIASRNSSWPVRRPPMCVARN